MVKVMEMGKEQIEPKREQAQENYLQKKCKELSIENCYAIRSKNSIQNFSLNRSHTVHAKFH